MSRVKSFLRSPAAAVIALVLAAALLLFSGVNTARAYLRDPSEWFTSRVEMEDIGISLLENGEIVSYRNYNSAADGTWDQLVPGTLLSGIPDLPIFGEPYEEVLQVQNTGTINEYVRVTITRYWLDAEGNKLTNLSPELIGLTFANLDSAWIRDTTADTPERVVLYYNRLLRAGDEPTVPFVTNVTISNAMAASVHAEINGTDVHTVYDFDGVQFVLDVRTDGVQEHNAQEAIKSAWGRNVVIDSAAGTLALE